MYFNFEAEAFGVGLTWWDLQPLQPEGWWGRGRSAFYWLCKEWSAKGTFKERTMERNGEKQMWENRIRIR